MGLSKALYVIDPAT